MSTTKKTGLLLSILIFTSFVLIILWGTAFSKLPPAIPIIFVTIIACCIGKYYGYQWADLQKAMFESVTRVLPAIFIVMAVGMLVGVWILSGTIPTFIFYSLQLISPSSFLLSAFILCVVTSVLTGTSYGTMGTIGVALFGVGLAMGYPASMVVGAIVSGAYFGDKISPASSSTNITAAVCEVDLFSHMGSMLWTTIPTFIITCGLYFYLGMGHEVHAVNNSIPDLLKALHSGFNITLWTLIAPAMMLLCAIRKFPAIPSVMVCIITGVVLALVFQHNTLSQVCDALINGFTRDTGFPALNALLHRGGAVSVLNTVMLCIVAVSFGGVLERIGILSTLVSAAMVWARNTGRLVVAVLMSGYITLIGTGAQVCTIIIPARAFADSFEKRNIHARVLSRSIEDSGVIASPLLPWGVHAFYIMGVLGVSAYEYVPYAFMCWLVPIIAVLFGYTGIGIWDREGRPVRKGFRAAATRTAPADVPHGQQNGI